MSVFVMNAQTTVTIGTGTTTAASSNAGPIYRSSAASAFDFSQHYYLYTQAELSAAGIFTGATISKIAWNKTATGATVAAGNLAKWDVYMKNSSVAPSATWSNGSFATQSTGATLVYTNSAQVIPATAGFLTLTFSAPFVYTGGNLEIGVNWDCSLTTGSPTTAAFTWTYTAVTNQVFGSSNSTSAMTMTLQTLRPNVQLEYSGGTFCTGTPSAGIAVSSASLICSGGTANLSLTGATSGVGGLTYQWQSSPAGVSTFTNISGATNPTYTATVTANTDYQCIVGCTPSGLSATSSPVTVSVLSTLPAITTISTPSVYQIGSTITLSNTGLPAGNTYTYQWQSSVSGGAYANIAGATTSTYSTIVAATPPTSYQCIITACTPAISATSSVFTVLPAAGYCIPSSTTQLSWISAFSTTGGVTNITHTAAAGVAGGYLDLSSTDKVGNSIPTPTNFSVTAGGPTVGFAIWVDWNNNNIFETTEKMFGTTAYTTTSTGSFLIPAATAVGDYKMRVVTNFNLSTVIDPCAPIARGEYKDFTFTVLPPPACVQPSALAVSATPAVTSTTGTVTFTAPTVAPANGYEYYVSTTNTAPTAGTTPTGTVAASPLSLTGLTPLSNNYVWVRSNCGGALGTSPWAGPVNVFTNYCVTIPSTGGTGDIITNVTMGTLNNTTTYTAPNYFETYNNTPVDLSQGTNQTMSITFGTDGTQHSAVWIDFNQNLIFEASENVALSTAGASGGATVTYNLAIPLTASLGQTKMRVRGGSDGVYTAAGACTASAYGETEDYIVNIVAPPACLAPLTATNSAITATTANHAWTAPTPAPSTGYEWAVTTSSTAPASGTAATGLTASSTGLMPNTTYYLHVRSNCGSGFSAWTTSASFYTGYCIAGSTSATSFINDLTTTGGTTNISNLASGYSVGGYGDFTSQIVTQQQGAVVNVAGVYYASADDGASIFVDFNDNLDFETAERVYTSSAYQTGLTASFTVPATAPIGNHRMRVVINFNSTTPGACGSITRGEFEDYTLKVEAGVPCTGAPTGVAVSPVSTIVCGSGTANLTAVTTSTGVGITYQWETSPGGANSWTAISGATASTYVSPTVSVSTDYRCVLTCSGSSTTSNTASVTIGVVPTNDNCANAITLVHSTDPSVCATTAGTTSCATTSPETSPNCFFTSQDDDVWYSFTATSSIVKLNLTNITVANGVLPASMGIGLHAACGAADVVCGFPAISAGTASYTVFGLTVGTDYKVRVLTTGTTGTVNFNICLSVPAITAGTPGTCVDGSVTTVTAGNANTWIPLFDLNSNLIAEINANGNILGAVTPSVFTKTGPLRIATQGGAYMNRNIGINVATQPTSAVSVRLYFTEAEKAALDVAVPGTNNRADIVFTKEAGSCTAVSNSNGVLVNQTANSAYGVANHYVQTDVTSFSQFFLHKGNLVLPISIEFFKGSKLATGNFLDWKVTCTSASTVELTLERSADGRDFKAINTQNESAARCLQGFDYIDARPLAGANYYRLKITTPDGATRYSTIVVILNKSNGFELISIAPNPVKDRAILTLTSAKAGKMEITVSDIAGKIVSKQSIVVIAGNNPVPLSVATLGAGTYTIAAVNAEGETKTTRFVKY
jgi:hypothetical protein